MYEFICFTEQEGVATLTLNRPDKLNSFNDLMLQEIQLAFDKVANNNATRVLVINAKGKGFCAGQDLAAKEVQFLENGEAPDFEAVVKKYYKPLIVRLRSLRVPTIAAVHGVAAGAGASLALACDFVVASKSASFIQAFSQIGLIPDTGGTWFLPRLVGLPRAIGLAMLGDRLSAEKAAEWGLIWEVVEDDQFESVINGLASKVSKLPTKALVEIRRLIETSSTSTLENQLDLEAKTMGYLAHSKDYREGVNAFTQKRKPNFVGE